MVVPPWPKSGKWRRFLDKLAETRNISAACRPAPSNPSRAKERARLHPDFALQWEEAATMGAERLEEVADKRATVGTRKLLLVRGEPVRLNKAEGQHVDGWLESTDPETGEALGWGFVYVLETSDTLLIFLLKGALPDKYADRKKVDANVSGALALGVAVTRTMADAMAAVRSHRAAVEAGQVPPELPAPVAASIAAAASTAGEDQTDRTALE